MSARRLSWSNAASADQTKTSSLSFTVAGPSFRCPREIWWPRWLCACYLGPAFPLHSLRINNSTLNPNRIMSHVVRACVCRLSNATAAEPLTRSFGLSLMAAVRRETGSISAVWGSYARSRRKPQLDVGSRMVVAMQIHPATPVSGTDWFICRQRHISEQRNGIQRSFTLLA